MIIDRSGKILEAWWYSEGALVVDRDNPYNMEFSIAVPYDSIQKEQYRRIDELKKNLTATDHWDHKYIEGEYTEEEWAEKKAKRMAWRKEIREIEKVFITPTLTREEMDSAESAAIEKMKKIISEETTGQEVEEIVGDLGKGALNANS